MAHDNLFLPSSRTVIELIQEGARHILEITERMKHRPPNRWMLNALLGDTNRIETRVTRIMNGKCLRHMGRLPPKPKFKKIPANVVQLDAPPTRPPSTICPTCYTTDPSHLFFTTDAVVESRILWQRINGVVAFLPDPKQYKIYEQKNERLHCNNCGAVFRIPDMLDYIATVDLP